MVNALFNFRFEIFFHSGTLFQLSRIQNCISNTDPDPCEPYGSGSVTLTTYTQLQ